MNKELSEKLSSVETYDKKLRENDSEIIHLMNSDWMGNYCCQTLCQGYSVKTYCPVEENTH